jgi:hypothetical protein
VVLKAAATKGNGAISFASGPGAYSVTYTSGSGTSAADAVKTVSANGATVTLGLANAVANGGTLAITATGTNPSAAAGPQADDITVQPGDGSAETTNSVTFGYSVTAVSASVSDPSPGASATYVVGFKVTSALTAADSIYISEPAGPTDFSSVTGVLVIDATAHWQAPATGNTLVKGNAEVRLPRAVAAGNSLSVVLLNATNPSAGTVGDLSVSTSTDQVPAVAPAYAIGVGANSGVVVSVSPANTGALANYVISDLKASSALTGGSSTLTIEGPTGTTFPNDPSDYRVEDSTRASGSGVVNTIVSGGGTARVVVKVPGDIAAGDILSLGIQDTINPAHPSNNYSITVLGAVTGPPPPTTTTTAASTTTTTAPHATTTAPKRVVHKKVKPKPSISALTAKARVRDQKVHLRLRCSKATCAGSIALFHGRARWASRPYLVRKGHAWTFTLKLGKKPVVTVKRSRHHQAQVAEVVSVRGGRTVHRHVTLWS